MAKAKDFAVRVRVEAEYEVTVQAKNLEEAVTKAQTLEHSDVVSPQDGVVTNFEETRVVGVSE